MAAPGGGQMFDFKFAEHEGPKLTEVSSPTSLTSPSPTSTPAWDSSKVTSSPIDSAPPAFARKPLPPSSSGAMMQGGPMSPVRIDPPPEDFPLRASAAHVYDSPPNTNFPLASPPLPPVVPQVHELGGDMVTPDGTVSGLPTSSMPFRPRNSSLTVEEPYQRRAASGSPLGNRAASTPPGPSQGNDLSHRSRQSSYGSLENSLRAAQKFHHPLQYHHSQSVETDDIRAPNHRDSRGTLRSSRSGSPASSLVGENAVPPRRHLMPAAGSPQLRNSIVRPSSTYSALSLSDAARGRLSPNNAAAAASPNYRRISSANSPENRPVSYIDLLNVPYPQPAPVSGAFNNAHLRTAVGTNASLLSNKQTMEMYRTNAKKTNDPSIQYEFAVFMISAAQEVAEAASANGNVDGSTDAALKPARDLDSPYVDNSTPVASQKELVKEARQILQKLSDRSYPFAQYYLADGYTSGLFSSGKADYDRAFPLFVSAGKHGHAEASYRAALCYEYGWGCRKDPAKAVQFYRQSASKNHPGAMLRLGKACLLGDMGLGNRYREGLKWLKRATESADYQYNSAPYELGLLHETGYGDDVFQDETYAAQLFTKAADLGHPEANYRLGDAYEHGKLNCPRDPALSVHFYNGGAQGGHPGAMMALCAWYMVGAEPVLEKDENEAYEWARKAAERGLPKAEYALGYFTEMGIGCRRDPLEANVWYVRAADQGDERAKNRLATIRAAASGDVLMPPHTTNTINDKGRRKGAFVNPDAQKLEKDKDAKDCIVM